MKRDMVHLKRNIHFLRIESNNKLFMVVSYVTYNEIVAKIFRKIRQHKIRSPKMNDSG